jgi:DNA modification methylase
MGAQADFKPGLGDTGGASRFFYCAKPSKRERDAGLDAFPEKQWVQWQTANGTSVKPSSMSAGRNTTRANTHATVKPVVLMRYLCRLVTQKGGVVLDPFMGSGTTGVACMLEGFRFIGIDNEPEYIPIAQARIEHHVPNENRRRFLKPRRRL